MTTRHIRYFTCWIVSRWCWLYRNSVPLPPTPRRLQRLAAQRVAAWQARLAATQARRARRRQRRLNTRVRGQGGVA